MVFLSAPALLLLGWLVAGLLWWDWRTGVISSAQRPWTMVGLALLLLAMVLALAAVPGRPIEQLVRVLLLVEACYGLWYLRRRRRPVS